MVPAPRTLTLVAALAATACTPKEADPPRVAYDGAVATALATLATECRPIGVAAGQALDKASDVACTSDDAEVVLHLDRRRSLRSVHIKLLAPTTEVAHARLTEALRPVLDDHHLSNVLSHLDEPVPGGLNPIPQLQLEGYLYQIASEPAGDRRRYIVRIRID